MRRCTVCFEEKDEEEFPVDEFRRTGRHHRCKQCHVIREMQRRRDNGQTPQRGRKPRPKWMFHKDLF